VSAISTTKPPDPHRSEVWLVSFDPTTGAEIHKTRPAVVMNIDAVGRLPLRIVVPITDWKPHYDELPWFVHLPPDISNGLSKTSGADGFQVKSVSVERFTERVGILTEQQMADIAAAVALCVGFSP
jgi:mRNA interferase MazF